MIKCSKTTRNLCTNQFYVLPWGAHVDDRACGAAHVIIYVLPSGVHVGDRVCGAAHVIIYVLHSDCFLWCLLFFLQYKCKLELLQAICYFLHLFPFLEGVSLSIYGRYMFLLETSKFLKLSWWSSGGWRKLAVALGRMGGIRETGFSLGVGK